MSQLGLIFGWCVECALLVVLLLALCRLVRDRLITTLTMVAFAVRLAAAEALYAISALHLPLMRSLQLPGGFWSFGYDAQVLDDQARGIFQLAGNSRLGALHDAFTQT